MRVRTALAVLLTLASVAVARGDEVLAIARQQTFVVQSRLDDRKAMIGGGVVVSRNGDVLTLVTAAHIILREDALRILDVSRRAYYDVIDVRKLADYDLALIRVRAQKQFAVTPVTFAQATAGQPVWLWGHPATSFWRLTTGSVQQTDVQIPGLRGSGRIIISCQACTFGDSGSGVFDAQGRLLGVLTRAWRVGGGPVLFIEVEPASIILQETQTQTARN